MKHNDETNRRTRTLTQGASRLLAKLNTDDHGVVAVPSVYPNSMANFAHAEAFLDNAIHLCRNPDAPDFAIFGALLFIRHGLELWMKGMINNRMVDQIIDAIADGVADVHGLGTRLGLNKGQRRNLVQTLCEALPALKTGVAVHDFHTVEVNEARAQEAVEFIRDNPHLERFRLDFAWCVHVPHHGLAGHWKVVEPLVREFHFDVAQQERTPGEWDPWSAEEVSSLVEFLDYYDPDGDAFRYPSSLSGEWRTSLPALSLHKLGDLASQLRDTVKSYEWFLTAEYECHRLGGPGILS